MELRGPWLSVVVPAYQEETGIARAIEAIAAHLERDGRPWELLVVDNASTDRTAEIVRAAASDRVRLLQNEENRGKGYSVRRGMLSARGELLLHCDADCWPCFEDLPRMEALLADADVVVGSRVAPEARVEIRQPLRRRLAGVPFVRLCRQVLDEPAEDLFCGFKLWRADAARAAFTRSRLDGWVFDAEVLALARVLGFRVVETGVLWRERPGSRLSMVRVLGPAVWELGRAWRNVRAVAGRAAAWRAPAAAAEQHP